MKNIGPTLCASVKPSGSGCKRTVPILVQSARRVGSGCYFHGRAWKGVSKKVSSSNLLTQCGAWEKAASNWERRLCATRVNRRVMYEYNLHRDERGSDVRLPPLGAWYHICKQGAQALRLARSLTMLLSRPSGLRSRSDRREQGSAGTASGLDFFALKLYTMYVA